MRTVLIRSLTACSLLCMATLAAADEVSFSNWGRQLLGQPQPQRQATAPGVRQIAYVSEIDAIEELPGGSPIFDGGTVPAPIIVSDDGYCGGGGCACTGHCCSSGGGCCESGHCCGSEDYWLNSGCGFNSDCLCPSAAACGPAPSMWYSETQLMFLRAHVVEEELGKLSEKYEFTPRFIIGHERASGFGARARYWTYGRTTPNLDNDDEDLRMDLDVIDVEGTTRLRAGRTDLVLACGFRWVNADVEVDDAAVESDMPGLTVAADVRSWVCQSCSSQWSGIGGARWSILGADWEGDDDALFEATRDDNLLVTELYGGVEYLRYFGTCNVYARLVFEVQNWRSDALDDTNSIGFVGPGVHVGATY